MLSSIFSPGTASIETVAVSGTPVAGVWRTGMSTDASLPFVVWGTVASAVTGLPDPSIDTLATTPVSSLSPWFWNLTVKARLEPAGMRLAVSGSSSVPCRA